MKILSSAQIKAADQYTITHEPIKSIDLMERAASACFDWIYQRAPKLFPPQISEEKDWKFCVVCGVGNNGGDGLAIARMLDRNGYNVDLVIVNFSDKPSDDFSKNFDKLGKLKNQAVQLSEKSHKWEPDSDCVLIDCLFGTGLSRKVTGFTASVIQAINLAGCPVVSIDLPSGMCCTDPSDQDFETIIRAAYILTFEVPKLAFYLAENSPFIGEIHILKIGLHADFIQSVDAAYELVDRDFASAIRQKRPVFSHKGTYGHVGIIAGSKGKYGAALLAVKAAMRAGAGKCTLHSGALAEQLLLNFCPEAMVVAAAADQLINLPDVSAYQAVVAGPGMGVNAQSLSVFEAFLDNWDKPVLLDADSLQLLANHPKLWAKIPKNSILTPHPGEFAQLAGASNSHFERLEMQQEISTKHGVYILLKGAFSSLSQPSGPILINKSGNAGMATAGAGDVLSGIIGALLANGYAPAHAASISMFVHGLAGDSALANQSEESLIASDIIDHLGLAFKQLGYA